MFTKQHYTAIADRLNGAYHHYKIINMDWVYEPLNHITNMLIDMFKYDNPKFDKEKFLEAVRKGI